MKSRQISFLLIAQAASERCDFCASEIKGEHRHLIEPGSKSVACACNICVLTSSSLRKITSQGAFHYKIIPELYSVVSDFVMPEEVWASLSIPVDMAFFVYSSTKEDLEVFFPSPLGPIQSELSQHSKSLLKTMNPIIKVLSHEDNRDALALLVNRTETSSEYFLIPIDQCYKLIGLMRKNWRGFGGGKEMHVMIAQFFQELRSKSKEYARKSPNRLERA